MMDSIHIDNAAKFAITARDFCGSEREAVKQYCEDEGVKQTEEFLFNVEMRVEELWKIEQKNAGVKLKYRV